MCESRALALFASVRIAPVLTLVGRRRRVGGLLLGVVELVEVERVERVERVEVEVRRGVEVVVRGQGRLGVGEALSCRSIDMYGVARVRERKKGE